MSTQAWPSLVDPRHLVQVGLARVRVGALSHRDAQPSALAWQQRMEDALRCASLGDGQRLVLIRKLQVRTGSASAPGWAEVVQAAAQDAVSRACHGRSAGADRADAVWFESWDDAVGAWLDAALGVGSLELSANAWYWPRIARMAGLPAASGGSSPGLGAPSARGEQARAVWARWQADPISQRACRAWSAQRPGVVNRLTGRLDAPVVDGPEVSAQTMQAGDSAHPPQASHAAPVQGLAGDDAHPQGPERQRGALNDKVMAQVLAPEAPAAKAPAGHRGWAQEQQGGPDAASTQAPSSVPDGLDGHARSGPSASNQSASPSKASQPHDLVHGDRTQATSAEARLKADRVDTAEPHGQAPQSLNRFAGAAEALGPTFRAMGWTHLSFTQLGGLPFTIRALQGLGFGHALSEQLRLQEGVDAHLAASAPWLHLWACLNPHARERWARDPMFAVLPAFERVANLPTPDQAQALWAHWQSQPSWVHALGQQAWSSLHRATRHKGWRSARELLLRPAWMQVSHTHLDVLFTLDQADLRVRRQGLDADPGWVPWLGRIVSLHFEPAHALPPHPLDRSTP